MPAAQAERDGSIIIVVLALLIGLLLLGILLFTDASQEEISAEYYAGAGKVRQTELNPEQLFHNALRQIILGANNNEKHSPFYGGRMSLLPLMFGADPMGSRGVKCISCVVGGGGLGTDIRGLCDLHRKRLIGCDRVLETG